MNISGHTNYQIRRGCLTESNRGQYIIKAIERGQLPENAGRMAHILSLEASSGGTVPIQFWQLFPVLGQDRIVDIVHAFYRRVFVEEDRVK